MKALFIPHFKANPYQRLLTEALRKESVESVFSENYRVGNMLRKGGFDLLHIHWLYTFAVGGSRIGTWMKSRRFLKYVDKLKGSGARIIWTVHNIVSHEGKHHDVELQYNARLARLCDELIVHSETIKSEVVRFYNIDPVKINIIQHGSYIGVYDNDITRDAARKRLGIGMDERVMLHFGFIKGYKGVPGLIKDFSNMDMPGVSLVIAGNPRTEEIKDFINGKCRGKSNIITRLEYIPDDDIQLFMNASDFVVLPFSNILTSGSLVLAMSFGKPVIAPCFGYVNEMIGKDGGLIYDVKDPQGLQKAMKEASEMDRDIIKRMGSRNFDRVKGNTWEYVAKETKKVYEKCPAEN